MTHHFGLYFGNTNMCLAVHKDSKVEVLANAAGYRVTPSVIAFLNDKEKIVGLDAKNALKRNAATGITNLKEIIKQTHIVESEESSTDLPKVNGKLEPKVDAEKNSIVLQYGLVEILSMLFTTLKDIACSFSHEDIYPTVVTVPLNFSEGQRELVREAVTRAGFQVLRIVSEPAAAALAYDISQSSNDSNSKCVVFRMGGTSTEVTVLNVHNGMYSVLSSVKKEFGGHEFTEVIANFCASEFQRQYKANIKENKRSLMKLRMAAEQYKHVVHSSVSERCQVESIYDGIDLNVNISKARFDSLIQSTVNKCLEPINEALAAASVSISDINQVILAGGSSKLPKVQQLLSSTFSSANVLFNISPDEVFAVGAAKQAIFINETVDEESCSLSLLSQDLSIKVHGVLDSDSDILLCCQGTLIPAVITQSFTVREGSSNIKVEIWEGFSSNDETDSRTLLAELTMKNLPLGEIFFSFHIRSDGSVFVTCKDCASVDLGSATAVPPRNLVCT